ncbi:MAG: transposase [Sandaracinaceae bacterium]|nr:transposase [Sandaracinaceae bacterium]
MIDELKAWQSRALERLYPVVYLDALVVKIRDAALVGGEGHAASRLDASDRWRGDQVLPRGPPRPRAPSSGSPSSRSSPRRARRHPSCLRRRPLRPLSSRLPVRGGLPASSASRSAVLTSHLRMRAGCATDDRSSRFAATRAR